MGDDAKFKDHIGYTRLTQRFRNVPDGSMSSVINVDFLGMPDTQDLEFDGKALTLTSEPSTNPVANAHATRAVKRLCGNLTSIVPGVKEVVNYNSRTWLDQVLRVGSDNGPAVFANTNLRVVSHSWLSVEGDPVQAIRRTDAMIDRGGILQVFALANEFANFPVMANCYNGIAVGRVTRESSLGPTTLDVLHRAKPDLLAPLHSTSQATPTVSSAIVLLAESAIRQSKTDAARPYVIKSVLMTGAQKLPANPARGIAQDWHPGTAEPGDACPIPLDLRQGAGMLRLDRSYEILQQPEARPGSTAAETGWTCGRALLGATDCYAFTLTQPRSFAATVVWHRHIRGFGETDAPLVNNLDLFLDRRSSGGVASTIARSVTRIDNVEHVYVPKLPAGAYALRVVGTDVQGEEPYGLSWISTEERESPQ